MTCPHCGRENDDDARFCQGCGAELGTRRALSGIQAEVINLLQRQGKIVAVKYYREQKGCSLKEALHAVEEIARANGVEPARSGCLGLLLIGLLPVLYWLM